MRGSATQLDNTGFWPTALCNFLGSDGSWWKADGCAGGTGLSKRLSLCLDFRGSPPTKLDLRPAFQFSELQSMYVRSSLSACWLSAEEAPYFWRFLWIIPPALAGPFFRGVCRKLCAVTQLCRGLYADSFFPILTGDELHFRWFLAIHAIGCNMGFLWRRLSQRMPLVICKIWPISHPL